MRWALGLDTKNFKNHLGEIVEYDYGDFMRAANLYLNELREELRILKDKNIEQRLDKMQSYLQFTPNWNVKATKECLLKDTEFLDEILHGHEQDWESASSTFNHLNSAAEAAKHH